MNWNDRCAVMLKVLRQARGLSQLQLAEEIESSASYICRIELGQTMPSVTALAKLSSALGLDIGGFLYLAERLP